MKAASETGQAISRAEGNQKSVCILVYPAFISFRRDKLRLNSVLASRVWVFGFIRVHPCLSVVTLRPEHFDAESGAGFVKMNS